MKKCSCRLGRRQLAQLKGFFFRAVLQDPVPARYGSCAGTTWCGVVELVLVRHGVVWCGGAGAS